PRYLSSEVVRVRVDGPEAARRLSMRLTAVRGVAEAVVVPEEGVAYLKVDPAALDREALAAAASGEG
ncbi:MAG TPA: MFS transporter, partial [Chromatiales bacterium]|nr:MFS transporter [Chromatiales bacterium]